MAGALNLDLPADGRWRFVTKFARDADGDLVGTLVSVPTPLADWANVGEQVDVLQITLVNLDPTNEVQLLVEFSEDGVHPDSSTTGGTAPPLQSVTAVIGSEDLQRVYRLSAHSDGPGFPDVLVAWQVKVAMRRRS